MPVQSIKRSKIYFENLDSLRFLAFFLVFISHSIEQFEFSPTGLIEKVLYVLVTLNGQAGPLGVQIFFVLSGFLITYLIFEEKRNNNQEFHIRKFYLRRMFRIWPLYFLAVFFGFFIYPALFNKAYVEKAELFNYVLFLSNLDLLYSGVPIGIPLSVLWSVAVEEQFYLFWPLVFLIPGRIKRIGYLEVFIFLLAISIGFQLLNHEDKWVNYFHSVSCMGSLVLGGILAYYYTFNERFALFIQRLPKWSIILVYFLGLSLIYLVFYIPSTYFFTLYKTIIALFFGFIIVEQNFSQNSFFKLGKISLFTYLGKLTYGLYILHPIGIAVAGFIFNKSTQGIDVLLLKFGAALVISIVLSFLSYNYFELVFLRLKSKFADPYTSKVVK